MTKEQAIIQLEYRKDFATPDQIEALDMAISALKGGYDDEYIDKAKIKAYFDGEDYGWEEGRKDLCDKISAEIETINPVDYGGLGDYEAHSAVGEVKRDILEIIEKYKGDNV